MSTSVVIGSLLLSESQQVGMKAVEKDVEDIFAGNHSSQDSIDFLIYNKEQLSQEPSQVKPHLCAEHK